MNKRKVLDAARKLAQKGAKEKALKEYGILLKVDSKDAKLLLEIGEWHRRWGQNDEAIGLYSKVADQYKRGGFDARAVAVFKQILNLDSKRYPAYVDLAELYQRMGLESDAVNALQIAADGYHKEGQKREALELLRKMATLDPSNTTSRLKVAELLRQEEMNEDALSEYEAVVEEFERQGDGDQLGPVYERILEIAPDRVDVRFGLARNLLQQGQAALAETHARSVFDAQPDGPEYFETISSIYGSLGKESELADVTRTMAKVYRDRGEEGRSRELMQRLPVTDVFDVSLDDDGAVGGGVSAAPADDSTRDGEMLLGDDFLDSEEEHANDLSGDNDFIEIGGDDEFELSDSGVDASISGPDSASIEDAAGNEEDPLPEGDPDQLFAEASVYLRYGKRDQAVASLQAILVQDATHWDALEKIGECFSDAGEADKAVEHWSRAARLARENNDEAALEVMRERISVLDPQAAAELLPPPIPGVEAGVSSTPVEDVEFDLEIEFTSEDVAIDGEEASPEVEAREEVDILMDDAVGLELSGAEEAENLSREPDEEIEIMLEDANVDVEIDDEAPKLSTALESQDDAGEEDAANSAGMSASSAQSRQISEDLEEAEFYLSQEIYDEAEAIYERILQVAPNHPNALLRLGEVRAARGEDPNESTQTVLAEELETPAVDAVEETGLSLDEESTDEDLGTQLGEDSELDIAVDIDPNEDVVEAADSVVLEDDTGESTPDDEASFDDELDFELDESTATDVESPFSDDSGEDGNEIDLESAMAAATAVGADDSAEDDSDATEHSADAAADIEAEFDLSQEFDAFDSEVGTDSTMQVEVDQLEDGDENTEEVAVVFDVADDASLEAEQIAGGSDIIGDTSGADEGVEADIASPFQAEDTMPLVDDDDPDEELVFESDPATVPRKGEQGAAEHAEEAQTARAPEAPELQPELQADSSPEEEDDAFDLGAELRESLEDDEASTSIDDPGASRRGTDDGFDSIFKDFKAGVSKTLSEDDHETRFDLGIAYREMELYDDAIDEFTICLGSPSHRLESLHMMGLCALDLDRFGDAVNHFEQALASEGVEIQKAAGLHFDLGRAFEARQSWSRAQEAYRAAKQADASIPGIEERIAGLEAKLESSAENIQLEEAGGEVFESFDDLVAEVEAGHDTDEGGSMESFDDVIADAEAVDEEPEEVTLEPDTGPGPDESAEASEALDAPPETAPPSEGGGSKRRKKRISFV